MKKTLLIAFAGVMMFAFTQCGPKDSNGSKNRQNDSEENAEEAEEVEGSQEYVDFMKAAKEYESQLKKARCCEDLVEAEKALERSNWFRKTINNSYEEEKMTSREQDKFERRADEIEELLDELIKEYGCEEESDWDDDDDYYSYGSGSKEYREKTNAMNEIIKIVNSANTCDDLQLAALSMLFMFNDDYADNERMTSSEEDELNKLMEDFERIYDRKSEALRCDDDSNDYDDDDDDDFGF